MFGFAPLAVIVLVIVGVFALGRLGHQHPASPSGTIGLIGPRHGAVRTRAVHRDREVLDAWTAAGLISTEQAERIEAYERTTAEPSEVVTAPTARTATTPRRVPFVAEALGYLGGILGIVGLVLLIAKYWPDMGTPGRLALSGSCAAALALAGALVHETADAAFARLRWFLWLLSSVAGGLFAGVLAVDLFGHHPATNVALVVAIVVTLQNGVFWRWRERPVQQFLTLLGAAFTVGFALDRVTTEAPTGAALMAFGALLVVAGWIARTPQPGITAAVGAAAAIAGSELLAAQWQAAGLLTMVCTAGTLLGLAGLPNGTCTRAVRTALVVIGGVGAVQAIAPAIVYFGQDAGVATGAAVWAIGACLVLLGSTRMVRAPLVVEALGGAAIVGGAAVTGMQSVAIATTFGLATAVGLIAWAAVPGRVLLSLFGSAGLLVNVPWAVTHFFPGEGRAPLLILASGAVIVAVAVWMARMGGRFRRELRN